jgi:ABC-type uncharacterized transport system permease subunit
MTTRQQSAPRPQPKTSVFDALWLSNLSIGNTWIQLKMRYPVNAVVSFISKILLKIKDLFT